MSETESVDNNAPSDEPAEAAPSRKIFNKKVLIIGVGVIGAAVLVGGGVAWLLMPSHTPPETGTHTGNTSGAHKKGHEVAIAPPSHPTTPLAQAPHRASSAADAGKGVDALKAEIRSLEEEKKALLEKQVELLKEQTQALHKQGGPKGGVLAGERECQISIDKEKRKQDLRACFGLPVPQQDKGHEKHADAGHSEWTYSGAHGPEYWGKLKSEFSLCDSGHRQSPINIVGSGAKGAPDLQFEYRPSQLNLVNNGHTLLVNYDKGSFIRVGGQKYELVQFHFHTPSEELINGRAADMVVHLVHKNEAGQLAVVGVLMQIGQEHAGLAPWWPRLPEQSGKIVKDDSVKADAGRLLPRIKDQYFSFEGSLTTPPCTEGVKWFVMKQTVTLSESQLKRFTSIYSYNARPVQPRYERVVLER